MRLPFRQSTELLVIFVTAFIVVAFIYAFLAAFTSFFYRKLPEVEYSYVEKLIRSDLVHKLMAFDYRRALEGFGQIEKITKDPSYQSHIR